MALTDPIQITEHEIIDPRITHAEVISLANQSYLVVAYRTVGSEPTLSYYKFLDQNFNSITEFELIGEGGINNLQQSENGDIFMSFYNDGDVTIKLLPNFSPIILLPEDITVEENSGRNEFYYSIFDYNNDALTVEISAMILVRQILVMMALFHTRRMLITLG